MWVFGYGSLIWKPEFPYIRREVGYVAGYDRRFWWKSFLNRGTRDRPGRVLILRHTGEQESKVWGVSYEVENREWEENVRSKLAERERHGMVGGTATFYPLNEDIGQQSVWLCEWREDHEQWAGPDPNGKGGDIDVEAAIIAKAEGLSGSNKEYLYKLCEQLDMIQPSGEKDEYIEKLVNKVKAIENDTKIV